MRYYNNTNPDGSVIQIHIADIHFGAIDPMVQYNILTEQFIKPISQLKFDILSIDGDLFDKKFLASSLAITYAVQFVTDCANLCMANQATLVLISGTESHDAGQLSLFYGMESMGVDIRIVESIQFQYIKGLKVLCIPEEYGKSVDYYVDYLCQPCDAVFMHGTLIGSVYGANKYTLNTKKAPVFDLECFSSCVGPVIAGHVHKAACYGGYNYYVSDPIRHKFGEEEEKGYAIVLQGPSGHLYRFIPIHSFRYDTVSINDIAYSDPNDVIVYLDNLLANGIDHIRIDFSDKNDFNTQTLVEKYYSSNPNVSIKRFTEKDKSSDSIQDTIDDKYANMGFLTNKDTDSYTKFVEFVNYNEGKEILSVQLLKDILAGK